MCSPNDYFHAVCFSIHSFVWATYNRCVCGRVSIIQSYCLDWYWGRHWKWKLEPRIRKLYLTRARFLLLFFFYFSAFHRIRFEVLPNSCWKSLNVFVLFSCSFFVLVFLGFFLVLFSRSVFFFIATYKISKCRHFSRHGKIMCCGNHSENHRE